MQSAITYSQGDQVLNEDARIQFRNLARQQAVVGLANRRLQLKKDRNVADEQSEEQLKGFNGGNWNKDYSAKIEQSLGAKENDSLNAVANKMLDQQLAAQAEVHPIRITMPIQGRHLAFYRELQIKPQAAMTVSFKAGAGWPLRVGGVVLTLLGLSLIFWVAARAAFARRDA